MLLAVLCLSLIGLLIVAMPTAVADESPNPAIHVEAIAYDVDGEQYVEVVFEDATGDLADVNASHVTVTDRDGSDVTIEVVNVTHEAGLTTIRVHLNTSIYYDGLLRVDHGAFENGYATFDIAVATTTIQSGTQTTAFIGEHIAIVGAPGETLEVATPAGTDDRTLPSVSHVLLLDNTAAYDRGDTIAVSYEDGSTGHVELREFWTIDVDTDSPVVTRQTADLEVVIEPEIVGSPDGLRGFDVVLVDEAGEVVDATWGHTIDDEGLIRHTFTDVPAGTYEIQAIDMLTGRMATTDVQVIDERDIDLSFADGTFANHTGDVVDVVIDIDGEEIEGAVVTFSLRTILDTAYEADLELTLDAAASEEGVILHINSYYAGIDPDRAFTATNAEVTAVEQTTISPEFRLPAEPYEMQLRLLGRFHDAATLELLPRETGEFRSMIAPGATDVEPTPPVLTDAFVERDIVAVGDHLVLELPVSGIFGYAVDGDAFDRDEGDLTFEVALSGDVEEIVVDERDDAVTLVTDVRSNTVWFVIDTDAAAERFDNDPALAGDGIDITVTFALGVDNPYVEDDPELREASISLQTPRWTFDDAAPVEATSSLAFGGETNLAPGTDVRLRVTEREETPMFQRSADVTIDDGTWSAEIAGLDEEQPGLPIELALYHEDETFATLPTWLVDPDVATAFEIVGVYGLEVTSVEEPGEAIIEVENVGEFTGSTDVTLVLGDHTFETRLTDIDPGEVRSVSFDLPHTLEPDTYAWMAAETYSWHSMTGDLEVVTEATTPTPTPTPTPPSTPTPTPAETPTPTPDDQPGFGVVLALIAILAAIGVFARRVR